MIKGNGTINKVILVGEISHHPRWHRKDNGSTALCFMLTTIERFPHKTGQGEHKEEHYIRLPGNKLEHDLQLGQWVHIEGKIKTSSFMDTQSIKRYKTEVVAIRIQPLPGDH